MELPSFRLTEFFTDQTSVVCQARSTHNLRLPCHAEQVVAMYQAGYDDNDHQGWTNVCHPLAELLHHMVDQKCRYGALTSATRTYFVRIAMPPAADDTALSPIVEVSDAWYVGQRDYIKAWAYAHHQGCSANVNHESSVRWEAFGSCRTKKPTRREQENARASLQHAALLENVSYEDITIVSSLGEGRNGTTFKARWKGIDVAMKQYDLDKGGEENFLSELSAYAKLRDVWGMLVPKPLFLSEARSGGVQFLGLQLGREY
jgi:hypothetical protein